MAVIEIAKIKVRRGQENVTGLPTLDSGEFGWAIDTQQLYIGNGTLAEGAPEEGRTRLLTEHDVNTNLFNLYTGDLYSYLDNDLFQNTTNGSHRDANISSNLVTTVDFRRSLVNKLNDFVTIYDFGGINDGTTDNAPILQQAIDEIWAASDRNVASPRNRVALRIPAGTYNLESTVYLPPYTTLIGDGQGKTILRLVADGISLMQTCDISVSGSRLIFNEGDPQIQNSIAGITLSGITFEWLEDFANIGGGSIRPMIPMLRLDCATDSQIVDCGFTGHYIISYFGSNGAYHTNYTALDLRGQSSGPTSSLMTTNLLIDNCTFDGFFEGIISDYDVEDVVISNSIFRNLGYGIVGYVQPRIYQSVGPARLKIQNNSFVDIEQEAMWFALNTANIPTNNISSQNTFINVGNNGTADDNAVSAVLTFYSRGNRSIEDYFDRFSSYNGLNQTSLTIVQSRELIEGYGYIESSGIIASTLGNGTVTLAQFPVTNVDNQTIKIQYSVRKSFTVSRRGELILNVSKNGVDTTATMTETYTYTGSDNGNVEFSVSATNDMVSLVYINGGTADGTISYKFSQFQ